MTDIQAPDGSIARFPDDMSDADIAAVMQKQFPPEQAQGGASWASTGLAALKGASRAVEANFPGVDRMVALAKSRTGQPNDYASYLAKEQATNEQFAKDNPWTNAAGGLAASFPLVAATGGASTLGGAMLRGAGAFGLGGLIQGGASSPDLTNTADTGQRMAQGELTGGALGAAFPLAAAGIGKAVSPLAAMLTRGPGASDVAKLGSDVTAAYQNVKDLGASYSPEAFKGLTDKIAADAADADIDPSLNPKAAGIIKNLQARAAAAMESGKSITLPDLDKARQFVNDNLSGMPEPKQARFGSLIKSNIDDFIKTAEPQATVPKGAPDAPNFNPPAGPDANYVPPGAPAQDQLAAALARAPQAPPRGSGPAPIPLLDVMRNYGLQDEGGDLASMGFANKGGRAPGVDRAFKVIDKDNGVPMDEGLRVAKELGYMEPDDTVSDFINKLGDHPAYSRADAEEVARRQARSEFDLGMSPSGELGNEANYAPPQVKAAPIESPPIAPTQAPPAPSAADAYGAIQNARNLATRQFKAQALAEALSKAGINADVAGTGGNIENATRRRLASLMEREPWSQDELAQLNKMIHGTRVTNTLRQLGRFGPKGNALMAALEFGSGSPTMLRLGAAGMGAQGAESVMRRAGQDKLMSMILAGGQAPARQAVQIPQRAALAAALAARQEFPPRRNTGQ